MVDDRHVLRQYDGTRTSHVLRIWVRQQLFDNTGISLDRRSLLFGSIYSASMVIAAILAVILGFGTAAIIAVSAARIVVILSTQHSSARHM
jgi:hypothetical protein